MGRNKIPDALKVARGTDQPCRMAGDTVGVQPLTAVKAPKILKGYAKKVYEQTAAQLCCCRILTALDLEQLVMYAINVGRAVEAEEKMSKEGAVIDVTTKFGTMKIVSPWMKVQKDSISIASAIAQQFGLTPVSRLKIAQMMVPEKKNNEDPFAEFD